jgi:hypothetical protein
MYWEKKLEIVKKEFGPDDFKVPFTTWKDILLKIESKFIVRNNSNYEFTAWMEHLKEKHDIGEVMSTSHVVSKLPQKHYWLVLDLGKHYVYDCKPEVIESILSRIKVNFFIIDKKYEWMISFERLAGGKIKCYASERALTRFGPAFGL